MTKKIEGISDEFQELGSMLNDIDFSEETDKNEIYDRTLKNINYKEGKRMLKKKIRNTSILAACLLIVSLVVVKPTWAVDAAKYVINKITFGNVDFYQMSHEKQELPDFYKGKVFDKDGNPLTETDPYDKSEKLYDENGKEIFELKDNKVITVDEKDKYILKTDNIDEINDFITFDIHLPEYIPEGYEFKEATFEKYHEYDPKGSLKGAGLEFKSKSNDGGFGLSEYYTGDEPLSVMGDEEMETFKLNGVDAVLYKNGTIIWNKDGIVYQLGGDDIDKDTKIKIAESIK